MIDNEFYNGLTGVEKVMYRTAYEFQMDYGKDKSSEACHQAGLDELKRLGKLRKQCSKPQTYVDVSTGRKFRCTEAELEARNAFGY